MKLWAARTTLSTAGADSDTDRARTTETVTASLGGVGVAVCEMLQLSNSAKSLVPESRCACNIRAT
ncbi:MAG: hypothetical protein LC708_03245, partial [Actinobacteria bacterium]|nr:hypothetical protein [Actinomycetota bacterium]